MTPIALVSNWDNPRCGIQSFGVDLAAALTYAGYEVRRLNWGHLLSEIPTIYNWHPQTAPPELIHPPLGPALVIAHEVPLYPDVIWPEWFRRSDVLLMTGERFEQYPVFHYPSLDYLSPCEPALAPYRLGTTGLRGDGVELLRQAAEKLGWEFSCSPSHYFATRQQEIDRLAQCHVIALWYWATGRAQSLALPVCAAAGRPLLLSNSSMLLWAPFSAVQRPWTDNLDTLCEEIEYTRQVDAEIMPDEAYTWSVAVRYIRSLWRERGCVL